MENINNSYFDGHYKDIWRAIIPPELTNREIDFMLQYFNLQPGDKVLDLMCGYGRHALALARKGMEVTAVDNLGDYTKEITDTAQKENLPVKTIKADVTEYRSDQLFDLVLCMGNSLNFFSESEIGKLFSSIHSQLKKGGYLLINTWSLTEIVVKQFVEKNWDTINGLKYLADSHYYFQPTRIETETTIISPDGAAEIKKAIDYIFSVAEIEKMLANSGLILQEIYSIPGKKKFSLGDARAYIIAVK